MSKFYSTRFEINTGLKLYKYSEEKEKKSAWSVNVAENNVVMSTFLLHSHTDRNDKWNETPRRITIGLREERTVSMHLS